MLKLFKNGREAKKCWIPTEGRFLCGRQFCARGNWPEEEICPGCNMLKGTRGGGGGAVGGVLHCIEPTEEFTVVVEESTRVVSP